MTAWARRERVRRSARTAPLSMNPFAATVIGVLIQASFVAGCGVVVGQSSASTATRQVRISPVNGNAAPAGGFRVVASTAANATCEAGSEAIGLAYRCFAGNAIYDPCWAEKATRPAVLCLPYPWARTDVRLLVRGPLGAIPNQVGGNGPAEPWGVELAGGQRCVLTQGAHRVYAGRVLDYYCSPKLWLLRGLADGRPHWQANSVISSKAGKLRPGPTEEITVAWFGRPDTSR
jgi:hypothetical protein